MKRIYLQRAKTQIARPNTIRDINKQIVLNYVRERSPISRAEIARETNLQRSTVSAIIDSLRSVGLIEEIGEGSSTGGRKPTLLKLKTNEPVAIGIDLTPRHTTIALADLAGKVLEEETFPTSPDMVFMTEKIVERVAGIAEKYPLSDLAVGISVPGIADQTSGHVLYIPYFDWHEWDIGKKITERTNLPVTIDNDANAIALAELWFGRDKIRKVSNFITVLVGEGVGTGIVFDGQVYRGERGAAGEFGHMIVGSDAPVRCSCGSRDCWESHASENAIIARYCNLFDRPPGAANISQIIDLAKDGEPQALKAIKETASYLGIGISNLIVGLSPQAIVVSGAVTKAWDLIVGELSAIAERSVRHDLPKTSLMASSLGDNPTLIGALSLVLAKKFAIATKN